MVLTGYFRKRLVAIGIILAGLGALKIGFRWVDIRIFELFPVFLIGTGVAQSRQFKRLLLGRWTPIAAFFLFCLCGAANGKWYDTTLIASMIRLIAMLAGILVLWRLSQSAPRALLPTWLWQAAAAWLEVMLLHRIIARLSGVCRFEIGFAGSWIVPLLILVPVTFIASAAVHQLDTKGRRPEFASPFEPAES